MSEPRIFMGRMSDLDIALTPLDVETSAWSSPSIVIQVVDDASLERSIEAAWVYRINRYLTLELWCMGSTCWMGEEWT